MMAWCCIWREKKTIHSEHADNVSAPEVLEAKPTETDDLTYLHEALSQAFEAQACDLLRNLSLRTVGASQGNDGHARPCSEHDELVPGTDSWNIRQSSEYEDTL